MNSRRLLNALRFVCLAGALVAIGTAWSWERIKVHIDPWDEAQIASLVDGPRASLKSAFDALATGDRDGGILRLTELAEELEPVRLGARLEHTKTQTLDRLTTELLRAERLDEALTWTDELLTYNPRDFPGILRRAEIHRRLGNADEALRDMTSAYAVGAASGAAVAPYVEAMAQRGDREAVATALLELGSKGPLVIPTEGWEFRAAPGADFAFDPPNPMTPQAAEAPPGRFTWTLDASQAPRTMQGLRIDLPSACQLRMASVAIELRQGEATARTLHLDDLVVANHLAAQPAGAQLADGRLDPYVILMRGEAGPIEGVTSVRVTLEMSPSLSPAARELFTGGLDADERLRWTSLYGRDAVRALEAGLGR